MLGRVPLLLSLGLALVLGSARGATDNDQDSLTLVKKIIDNVNHALTDKKLDTVMLNKTSWDFGVGSLSMDWVTIANFSTISLRGDDQSFQRKDVADGEQYSYHLTLGLDELAIDFEYNYSLLGLIRESGFVAITNDRQTASVKGVITKKRDGSCQAVLDKVNISNMGEFVVGISPATITHLIVESIAEVTTNFLTPRLSGIINDYVAMFLDQRVSQIGFSDIICKSLN